VTRTAANLNPAWIGLDARAMLAKAAGQEVRLLNDADAAGVAEMTFGAGKGEPGTVHMVTFGTGIGSALFVDGVLVPNTEFGHLEIRGKDAEERASERAKTAQDMSWKHWARNVNEYLEHIEALLSPQLIIVGGGISRQSDKFLPLLTGLHARVVPAAMHNDAGIAGAAMAAHPGSAAPVGRVRAPTRTRTWAPRSGPPAARAPWATRAPQVSPTRGCPSKGSTGPGARPPQRVFDLADPQGPKWNTLAASTASAPASTAGGSGPPGRRRARDDRHRDRGADRADQLQVKSGFGAIGVHRVEQDLARAQLGAAAGPGHGVNAGAAPAAVRGDLESARHATGHTSGTGRPGAGEAAGVHRQHDALGAEAAGRLAQQVRAGDGRGVERDLVRAGPQQPVDVLLAADAPPTVSGMNTCSAVRRTTS